MKLFKITRCRLLLAMLICLGTGSSSGQTTITLEANQKMLSSGMRIEFGSIDIGGYKTQNFTVTNASLSPVTGLTCTLDGANAADFVLSTPTLADLAVGAAVSFSVTYVPELEGKTSVAALHVRSSGGSSYELPLTATGGNLNPTVLVEEVGGAVVTSLSRPLDFGSPMIGQSTSKTFRITNTGTAPLREVSVARDDPWHIGSYRSNWGWLNHDWGPNHIGNYFYYDPTYQYESGFTVTGLSSSIPPGESRTITVTWLPYETVQKTRNITLSWAMRDPPPTYDLTGSSSVQFVLSTSVVSSLYGQIIPYIPPVRFSIPVTGAAVPYVLDPQLLAGLEFHLGNENGSGRPVSSQSGTTPSDPMLGPTLATAPDDAILTTGTLARWNPSAPAADQSNDWRSHTQRYLTISAPIDFEERPLSVFVTGDGSAMQALGSRTAVAFSSGTRQRNTNIQLPTNNNVGMELWLKPTSLAGSQCVAFMGATADTGFGIWLVDGMLQGRAGTSIVAAAPALEVDVWHHVTFIVKGGSASLYLDGALAGSAPSVILPVIVRGLSLGAMLNGTNGYEGQADELRLFEIPASGFDVTRHLLANAQPSASLDRIALDFGNVEPAAWTTRSFTLANTGPGWLRLVSMELIGDGASDYRVYAVGSSSGAMPIQPDPTPFPVYPSSGWSWSNWFGIINNGSVGTLSYTAPPALPAFIGRGTSIFYRAAIAPQTKVEAYVSHSASTLGPRPATLRITTNDPAHPVYEIALNATTVVAPAPEPQPQIFVQRIRDIQGERLYTNDDSWDWGALLPNAQGNCIFGVKQAWNDPLLGNDPLRSTSKLSVRLEIIGPNAEDVTFSTSESLPSLASANGNGVQILSSFNYFTTYIHLTVRPRSSGARYAALRVTSDDPARPEIIIPIYGRGVQTAPEIAVTLWGNPPSSLVRTLVADGGRSEFAPALSGGHSADLSFSIHNIGNAQLDGISMSIDGPDAADFTAIGTLPTNISPYNNSAQIQLRFTPSRVGTHTATLHVLSNDADESPYDITLTGEGLTPAPIMQVIDRDTVTESGTGFTRMGNAVIGAASVTQTLRLRNAGTAPLTGFKASFSGPNASEFSASLPSPIAAGAAGDVIIAFAPEDIGPRSAVLTLTSNDPNNSTYRMNLGGTGAYGVRSNLAPPAIPGWVGTAMAELPDGSIVMAGYVAAGAGESAPAVPTSRLRIIGKDGSERKRARLQHMTISGVVKSICVRADGSLLMAGDFTRLWGSLRPSNVTNGWMPPPGYDPRPYIDCQGVALMLSDTAWMPAQIGGALLTISSGGQAYHLAWSTSFAPPTGTFSGRSVVALPDGKVLVGGSGSLGGRANLIRLNADGTIDPTFTLPEPNGPVNALAMQDDGKVIVGGEFTNLGHDKLATETEAVSRFPSSTTPRTGLARLNADGSDDATFANRGFHQVMSLAARGDSIAVGGVEKQYSAITHTTTSSSTAPPGYVEIDQAVASLLGRDGAILATQPVREIPQAVALQPGNRMLFDSRRRSLIDSITYPSVALLQPTSAPTEWLGVSIASDVLPATTSEHFLINYQKLLPTGDSPCAINAIIAQADGKMLVAGDFSRASVSRDPRGYRSDGPQFPPQPTPLLPVLDNSALPAETPLAGFVQLDVDGFYHASPEVSLLDKEVSRFDSFGRFLPSLPRLETSLSDGLRKVDFGYPTDVSYDLTIPSSTASSPSEISLEGADAIAFKFAFRYFPFSPLSNHFSNHIGLSFTPTHQGKHYAVLKVHQPGIDNDFEIALEGMGSGSLADQVLLTDDKNLRLSSTDQREMGSVALGSSANLEFRLSDDSNRANTSSFELRFTGPHASEFSVSPMRVSGIPPKSRNGAGFVPIQVTFTPTSLGPRMATLNLVTVSGGPVSGQRTLPFVISLTGEGLAAPLAFTSQPQDVLVMQDSAFSLSFLTNSTSRIINGAWHHQRGSRDRIVQEFVTVTSGSAGPSYSTNKSYSIASASAEDAGVYRAVIQNGAGRINSRAAQVGVVSVLNRDVFVGRGQVANLGVSFAGPPTLTGQSSALYQWLFMGQPLTNSTNITGANSANLTLAKVEPVNAGDYACQITLGTASLITPPITVSLVEKPQVTGLSNLAWAVAQPVDSAILSSGHVQQFSVQGLPPGVRLNTSTGQLNGRPTKAGTYNLRITASNAAGISRPFTTRVVVLPLPQGVFGSFFGTIYRNPEFNDGLGGTWNLTVTTTGAYSAKLNLATSELSRKKKGKMKTLTLSGIILPKGDWAETLPVTRPNPKGGAALQVSFRLTAKTVVNGEDQHTAAILFLKENHRDQSNGAAFGREKTPRAAVGRFSSGSDQKLDLWVSPSGASFWTAKIQTDSGPHTVTGSAPFITWGPSLFLHQILPHPTQPSSIVGLVQWFGFDTWSGETDLRKPESVTAEEMNGILIPRDSIQAKRVKPPTPTLPTLGPAPKRFR